MLSIGILIYADAQMAAVLGMTDLFHLAGTVADRQTRDNAAPSLVVSHWQVTKEGAEPELVYSTSADHQGRPDICILPPSLAGPAEQECAATAEWLGGLHARGAILASVCAGAFVLGATGLLAGRPVTTHWSYEQALRARNPTARINTDRLIIDDGDIITAGGVMAWTDLALVLIDRRLGAGVMIEVAHAFLIDPPGREQSFYSSFSPRLSHRDLAVLKVQKWLQETKAKTVDVSTLAAKAGLEERTFLRRFRKATGMTSTDYWQRLRVAHARTLLQEGFVPTDQVAWDVGYADASAFRKVFSRVVGLTPSEYRARFGGARR